MPIINPEKSPKQKEAAMQRPPFNSKKVADALVIVLVDLLEKAVRDPKAYAEYRALTNLYVPNPFSEKYILDAVQKEQKKLFTGESGETEKEA